MSPETMSKTFKAVIGALHTDQVLAYFWKCHHNLLCELVILNVAYTAHTTSF